MDNNPITPENAKLAVRIGNPSKYFINEKIHYLCNVGTKLEILSSENENVLTGEFGITGVFTTDGNVDKITEEKMVKINMPALLMPYLRAAMTNILSNAGFGTMLFPLVNVYEIAKTQNLSIIDHSENALPPSPQLDNEP
jgi:preprotein translocase subunit SecB